MGCLAVRVCALLVLLSANGDMQTDTGYLRDPSHVENKEHIREHMNSYYKEEDIEEKVDLDSEESVRFHFFKLHDQDNNGKLDGLELYAAILHHSAKHESENEEHQSMSHEQITKIIDEVLKLEDANEDGFVDYYEFSQALEANSRAI